MAEKVEQILPAKAPWVTCQSTVCAALDHPTRLRMNEAYRCFFCGRWFCWTCAFSHFQMTAGLSRVEFESALVLLEQAVEQLPRFAYALDDSNVQFPRATIIESPKSGEWLRRDDVFKMLTDFLRQ